MLYLQYKIFEGRVFSFVKVGSREYFCIQDSGKSVFVYKESREYFCSSPLQRRQRYIEIVKDALKKKSFIKKYYKSYTMCNLYNQEGQQLIDCTRNSAKPKVDSEYIYTT